MTTRRCRFLRSKSWLNLDPRLQEGEILFGVLKDVFAAAHVRAGQLIGGPVEVAELEFALTQTEMQERVSNRIGTMYRRGEVVPGRGVIVPQKISVSDRRQNPRGGFPLCLRLGKQIPGGPVFVEGRRVVALCRERIPLVAKSLDALVNFCRKLCDAIVLF